MNRNENKKICVGRFAPTPSGRMHLGNIFSAMIAYLSAKASNGKFLLRIEDLDRTRCPRALSDQILSDLEWFGFEWDDEVTFQSERGELYEEAFCKLNATGLIYPCFCSRARLHSPEFAPHGYTPVYDGKCRSLSPDKYPPKPPAYRVKTSGQITFTDMLLGRQTENLTTECGDFIVKRADGVFAYQLAVVVDDHATGVSEVVRGLDLLHSTARQIYLYRALGYEEPNFCHVPLVTDEGGVKMSKRDGKLNLAFIRERFTSPEAVIGALAASAGIIDSYRKISLCELIPLFDLNKLKRNDFSINYFGILD